MLPFHVGWCELATFVWWEDIVSKAAKGRDNQICGERFEDIEDLTL